MKVSEPFTPKSASVNSRPEMDYYARAFFRNIGLLSRIEQERLRNSCVAIPGLGGVGSSMLIALARAGVGKFRIADYDAYDVANTNRQYGASSQTIGRRKVEVLAEMVTQINPEAQIAIFPEPITDMNIDRFLSGANIVVDGLDFFMPDTRSLLYRKSREQGLYVVLTTHLGFSATLQVFSPRGISFDDYFNLRSQMKFEDKILAFIHGLAPKGLHRKYMNTNKLDYTRKRLPSLDAACHIATGLAVTEVLNILLRRKPVRCAPYYAQFDPYRMKYKTGYLWMGNRNPLQRLKIFLAKYFAGADSLKQRENHIPRSAPVNGQPKRQAVKTV